MGSLRTDQRLEGLAILLVEDDKDGRDVLEFILRHAGARVTTASTASEGFELYKAAPPAVLVTDIAMPGADGIWLLDAVRSEPGLPRVPAIAITALAMPTDRARLRAAGFDAHVVKPVDPEVVVRTVATLIGRSHRRG